MRFGVLGQLAVWTEDQQPVEIPEAKVRTVLGCLLARNGEPVWVDRLADVLWTDAPPRDPRGAVQRKVWQLRRVLDQVEHGGHHLVRYRAGGYLLDIDERQVDVGRFRSLVRDASDSPTRDRRRLLDQALALWRGAAYGDLADFDVIGPVAARLEEERLTALEMRAEARLELHEHAAVADELAELVAEHPFRERLRAGYLRALYGAGRQTAALEDYDRFRRMLADELGQDPGAELTELHTRILRHALPVAASGTGDTVQRAETPSESAAPERTAPATRLPAADLPAPPTELVGRDQAVDQVLALLRDSRLVTLTGPGGVGKTRLASEVARRLVARDSGSIPTTGESSAAADPHLPETVHVVELADRVGGESPTVRELSEAVASSLGLRDDTTWTASPSDAESSAARLARVLCARHSVLVLDNCEHVLDAVADLVGDLLKAAPELRVLATSRAPLGIDGEARWPVTPLPLADARRLFATRAQAADPSFRLGSLADPPSNGNGTPGDDDGEGSEAGTEDHAVTTICRRLDGIPLALELAATRVPALGVHEIARRLDDRFALLAGGRRGVPGRQQTLRAVIDWSWDLLTTCDQIVLRRLAVFTGGCTLPAAETVCAGDGVASSDVADALIRLVDWSLVTVVHDPESMSGRRYRLLESVQSYCHDRLSEAGEHGTALLGRHATYYADLAEATAPLISGSRQADAARLLDTEHPNLVAALEHATRQQDPTLALRIANALSWYWVVRGKLVEGRRLMESAVRISDSVAASDSGGTQLPPLLRPRALGWLGGVAGRLGDREAWRWYEEAAMQEYDRTHGPTSAVDEQDLARARTQWILAWGGLAGGYDPHHEQATDSALRTFTDHDDHWGIAGALGIRAMQATGRGDLEAVVRDGERSRDIFAELGDGWGLLLAYQALILAAEIAGDYQRAQADAEQALRIADELGIHGEQSYLLTALGRLALLGGDHPRSTELHQRALRAAAEQGDATAEGHAATGLGMLARREGRFDDAEAILRPWLEWNRRLRWQAEIALLLAELGFVAEERGNPEQAWSRHQEGLLAARSTFDPRAVALALEGLAGASALTGQHGRAARLLGAAETARDSAGAPLPPAERRDVDRIEHHIRDAIGEQGLETQRSVGARLGPDADPERF